MLLWLVIIYAASAAFAFLVLRWMGLKGLTPSEQGYMRIIRASFPFVPALNTFICLVAAYTLIRVLIRDTREQEALEIEENK